MSQKEDYRPSLPSVQTLLDGLFDYAGLFPPASLNLEQATEQFERHRNGDNSWMLGPFVVPVAMLPELARQKELLDSARPIGIDLLPRNVSSGVELEQSLEEDLISARHFLEAANGGATLEAIELRFPPDDLESANTAVAVADILQRAVSDADLVPGSIFLELQRRSGYQADLEAFFDVLENADSETFLLGAKLRCGGDSESAYPSTEELARFIDTAVKRNQPFKLTAGLHHPIRHERSGVWMHGFLNAIFATALAHKHELDVSTIDQVLQDTSADSFHFLEDGIAWQDLSAEAEILNYARTNLLLSIGSCSFDEPREDMATLGWLS